MSLFEKIFGGIKEPPKRYGDARDTFELLSGYTPVFRTWTGEIYESELVRAAIDARARHISKLNVQVVGTEKPSLQSKLRLGPNEFSTWSQTLYRLSTILDVRNTALIVPIIDASGETTGIYPVLHRSVELAQYKGEPWLRIEFFNGDRVAIELRRVGIMTKYQYRNDLFGESNKALDPTMALLNIQKQGIEEGVKNSASYRFMATLTNFQSDEDIAKERERFTELNLRKGGGVLLWKNTMKDVKQIDTKPFVADADQMALINESVNRYFGVNSDVLENNTVGDKWAAFYEGAVEPFAIQLSEVLTKMLFTQKEREKGTYVMATSNRLQYMSNADKLNVSSQLLDRGIMSINDVREIWQLPPVEGGDERIIRGEYYNASEKVSNEPSEQ